MLPLPSATIRRHPEDFRVEELPAYLPCGEGEHVFVTFEKRRLTTLQAVEQLAERLGVPARDCGTAGLKDRHAVTIQTASFFYPLARPLPETETLSLPGLRVLRLERHRNKLRTGHLRGNRFDLTLRDLAPSAAEWIAQRLEAAVTEGLPNFYGSQRFGHDQSNVPAALAWVRGEARPPRHPRIRRLQFSALQSFLFDQVLARRVHDETWNQILPGDLVYTWPETLDKPLDPAYDAAAHRGRGVRVATGPMFGSKMAWPEGAVATLEKDVLFENLGGISLLQTWSKLGEGTRRPLKVLPSSLMVSAPEDGSTGSLRVRFVLPKGAYATTVLQSACILQDAAGLTRSSNEQSAPGLVGGDDDMEEDT